MSPPMPPCKHGKRHDEECIDCLIYWSEDCIRSARASIEKHERKIAELRARLAQAGER